MRTWLLKIAATGALALTLGAAAPIAVGAESLTTSAVACAHLPRSSARCEGATGTDFAVADESFFPAHAVARASASFGSIGVSGAYETFVMQVDSPFEGPARAGARFEDTWTVGGFPGAGTISLTFDVSGFYSSGCDLPCALPAGDGFVTAAASVSFSGGSPNPSAPMGGLAGVVFNLAGAGPISLDKTVTAGPIPITSRVPFPVQAAIGLLLGHDVSVLSALPVTCGFRECAYRSSGVVDFARTATLAGIEVRDAAGNLVPDFTLETKSGAPYGVGGPGPPPGRDLRCRHPPRSGCSAPVSREWPSRCGAEPSASSSPVWAW